MGWLRRLAFMLVLAGVLLAGCLQAPLAGKTISPSSLHPPTQATMSSSTITATSTATETVCPDRPYPPNIYSIETKNTFAPDHAVLTAHSWRSNRAWDWTVVNATGTLLKEGPGEMNRFGMNNLEVDLADPGVYFVRLRAYDCQGNYIGTDARAFGTGLAKHATAICPPVTVGNVSRCPAFRFGAVSGLADFSFEGKDYVGGSAQSAYWPHRLVLYDAADRVVASNTNEDFLKFAGRGNVTHGEWRLEYQADAAAEVQIEYGVFASEAPGLVPWPTFPDGWTKP